MPGRTCIGAAATRARGRCCWPRDAAARARDRHRRRRRHGAHPRQQPADAGRHLHRQRARSSRASRCCRTRCAAPTPTPSSARCASTAFSASPTITCGTTRPSCARGCSFHLEHARRAGPLRRRVDGRFDLVPRVLEELGVRVVFHTRRAAPRQAAVVRRRALRRGGVRAARQPGLDAGVPDALRRCRPCSRAMGQAPTPPRAHRARRAGERQGAAHLLSCRCASSSDDWGRTWAKPAADQWLGRLHARWPAPTASSSCRPGPTPTPKGFVTRLYRWSRPLVTRRWNQHRSGR